MFVSDEDQTLEYRKKLVREITIKRKHLAQAVKDAFLHIPRHLFLDFYYQQKGNTFEWYQIQAPDQSALPVEWLVWYNQIYADEPLVTQIDKRGHPTSSSSQPNVMAQMIEALSISPGHFVLEIGTGTGYNAALLCYLVGTGGTVISLDIDPHIANTARERIKEVARRINGDGQRMNAARVVAANALTWNSPVLFDRILATGSCRDIPVNWLRRLKPNGMLVMEWRGSWMGSLLHIVKTATGYEATPITNWHAAFMPLRSDEPAKPAMNLRGEGGVVEKYDVIPFNFHDLEQNTGLLFWLQYHMPEVKKRKQIAHTTGLETMYLLDEERKTTAIITQHESKATWNVSVYGEYRLWSEFQAHCTQWSEIGQPTLDHYMLKIVEDGSKRLVVQ